MKLAHDLTIWSGGEPGAGRGALEAAIAMRARWGGWCARGRCASDGPIPERYHQLREADRPGQARAMYLRVAASDATLIVAPGPLGGDVEREARLAEELGRPVFLARAEQLTGATAYEAMRFVQQVRATRINVVGPLEHDAPGITAITEGLIVAVLERLGHPVVSMEHVYTICVDTDSRPRYRTLRWKRTHGRTEGQEHRARVSRAKERRRWTGQRDGS